MAKEGPPFTIPWHRPENDDQNEENIRAIERINFSGEGSGTPTVVIAAADSYTYVGADFVCDGNNDQVQIQQAVLALTTASGGRIVFREGTYACGSTINVATQGKRLEFHGLNGAFISCAVAGFLVTGGGVTEFNNLRVTAAGIAIAATASQLIIHDCTVTSSGAGAISVTNTTSGQGSTIYDNIIRGSTRGVTITQVGSEIVRNNRISLSTSGGIGVRVNPGAGFATGVFIVGNTIAGAGAGSGVDLSWNFFDHIIDAVVDANTIDNFGIGIYVEGGERVSVIGNKCQLCGSGIVVGNGNTEFGGILIEANLITDSTGTRHILIQKPSATGSDCAVIFNKCRGNTPTYAIEVGAGVTDCAVAYNDTWGGFATAAVLDAGTTTRRERDFANLNLDDLLDVNAPAPADTNVLSWNAATNKWIPAAAGGGGGGTSSGAGGPLNVVHLRRAANQALVSTTDTAISWDTEDSDLAGFIVVTSDTLTVPAGLGGEYIITFEFTLASQPDGRTFSTILAGGISYRTLHGDIADGSLSEDHGVNTVTVKLAAADTIQAKVRMVNGGGNINVTGHLNVVRVSSGVVSSDQAMIATATDYTRTGATTYAEVDSTNLVCLVDAAVDDVLMVSLSCVANYNDAASNGSIDVHTRVSGTRTNSVASKTAVSNTHEGVQAWRLQMNATQNVGGVVLYKVVAGDIVTGAVSLTLAFRAGDGTKTITIYKSAVHPIELNVINLGKIAL